MRRLPYGLNGSRVRARSLPCTVVPLVLALTGCDDGLVVCISAGGSIGTFGTSKGTIVAEVRDGATGAPAAAGATMLVRSASAETSVSGTTSNLFLVWDEESVGSFDVTVKKPGYRDWRRHDVHVAHRRCGPGNAYLQVLLRLSD